MPLSATVSIPPPPPVYGRALDVRLSGKVCFTIVRLPECALKYYCTININSMIVAGVFVGVLIGCFASFYPVKSRA